jgi:hypothetical protein
MRKSLVALVTSTLLGWLCSPTAAAGSYSEQTIVLASATVKVTVYYNAKHGYTVRSTFHIDKGSPLNIGCLYLNTDFRYLLQDHAGKTIPINQNALSIADGPHNSTSVQPNRPCEQEMGTSANIEVPYLTRGIRLAPLYPNLPAGVYTLHITFAPHGILEERQLLPVQLVVDSAHPL